VIGHQNLDKNKKSYEGNIEEGYVRRKEGKENGPFLRRGPVGLSLVRANEIHLASVGKNPALIAVHRRRPSEKSEKHAISGTKSFALCCVGGGGWGVKNREIKKPLSTM